jgi:hypothetical protein
MLIISSSISRTWYIKADGSGSAPTIQAGVDSSSAGDTVLVAPGVYSDNKQLLIDSELKSVNIHLNKNIVLMSEEFPANTIIDGSNSDIAIYVQNVDSTGVIEDFKINTAFEPYGCVLGMQEISLIADVSKKQPDFVTAIYCAFSSIKIQGNEILDNGYAIKLKHSSASIIENIIGHSSFGVVCWDSSHAEIVNNQLYDCAGLIECRDSDPIICDNELFSQHDMVCDGIVCSNSSAYIYDNRIRSVNNHGITAQNSNIIVENNQFEQNPVGVLIMSGSSWIMRSNLFNNNGTAVEVGFVSNSIIECNTIVNSGSGILCQYGSPEIRNNIIFHAVTGIACVFSSAPVIECNNIYNTDYRFGGNCTDQTGINGNISVDPEFCGIIDSGNYYLQSDSPCAPGNHPDSLNCGLIGAFDVNCGTVSLDEATWGIIKHIFRGSAEDTLRE